MTKLAIFSGRCKESQEKAAPQDCSRAGRKIRMAVNCNSVRGKVELNALSALERILTPKIVTQEIADLISD
jgi:hypothetical protein